MYKKNLIRQQLRCNLKPGLKYKHQIEQIGCLYPHRYSVKQNSSATHVYKTRNFKSGKDVKFATTLMKFLVMKDVTTINMDRT
jgi:hypothetical protein